MSTFFDYRYLDVGATMENCSYMKLLHVIPTMDPKMGGPCQGIRNIYSALVALGVSPEVVCFDHPNAEYIRSEAMPIHALGKSGGAWHYNRGFFGWLKKYAFSYDVIVVHGLWLYHGYAAWKFAKEHKFRSRHFPKLFVIPHGMLDPWFQREKSRKFKALRNEVYWRFIEKKCVNDADGLLFTCYQELALARKTFNGYAPKREIDVGYGIKEPPPHSEYLPKPIIQSSYLLFLGRIHPKKGVDILIEGYKRVKLAFPDLPDLVISGPLDSEYALEMQKRAVDCKSIHFTGMLERERKWGAIFGCDAFVLPSHQENFGIAVVEAMACNKAVLISDQVNICKEIESGGGGLISSDTVEGVEIQLTQWHRMFPEDRAKMGRKARETYLQQFSIATAAYRLKSAISYEV